VQYSLLAADTGTDGEQLSLPGAELRYYPAFYSHALCADYQHQLLRDIPWQQDTLSFAGKPVPVPRLQSWHGDSHSHYGYSGLKLVPQAWTPLLSCIRTDLQSRLQLPFNSVLLNWYRNGNDSVAWHSDDEPELGPDPQIASLSFGIARRFDLKHRTLPQQPKFSIELGDGSLLLMGPGVQQHYLHQIPKQAGVTGTRLNLTFRFVHAMA
jgi:alkylated DNA repair dioxygenase AlkB